MNEKKRRWLQRGDAGCLVGFLAGIFLVVSYAVYWLYDNWSILMASQIYFTGEEVLRGIVEILLYVAFVAVCYWVVSKIVDH